MKCKNCDNDFIGNYCPICGQRVIDRLTIRHISKLIIDDVFDIDKGLIFTLKQLWINPGKTALDFIHGKTKNYYSPLKYLIFWTALFLIQSQFIGSDKNIESIESLVNNTPTPFSAESFNSFFSIYIQVLIHYTNFFYLGMVPFLTIISYIIYYKKKYFVTELSIPYLYLCGQLAFVLVITSFVLSIFGSGISLILILSTTVALLYLIIQLHRQFFKENWIKTIIKSLTILYLGQILYLATAYSIINLLMMTMV